MQNLNYQVTNQNPQSQPTVLSKQYNSQQQQQQV